MTTIRRHGPLVALALTAALLLGGVVWVRAQSPIGTYTQVQEVVLYPLVPISATGAANAQVTLTIPAPPPGFYNYVCTLGFNASNNNTGAVMTNLASTSTNFNSFAVKFSAISAASGNYDMPQFNWNNGAAGCPRSTSPGTATTFVTPAAQTNWAFTWYATYYQAP